jgi:hypothetical protein
MEAQAVNARLWKTADAAKRGKLNLMRICLKQLWLDECMCVFRSGATTLPASTKVAKNIFATETQDLFV